MLAFGAARPPRPSLTLLMTRPSSALRAPSPRERGEGELLKLLPLAPRERGEGGRRPGEGPVINPSAAHGAVIPLGMTDTFPPLHKEFTRPSLARPTPLNSIVALNVNA